MLDALHGGGGGRHRDADRVAQHLVCQLGDLPRHGRGEEQRLALGRQLGDDPADVVDEAHVEHAVGFVEHEHLDAIEMDGTVLHEVEQPAGGGDQDVDAVRERADLAIDRHAADGERHPRAQVAPVGLEALDDLGRKLARRAEHQHAAAARFRPPRVRWRAD